MHNEPASFIELSAPGTSRRYTEDERKSHCDEWKNSGLSMSDYCRQSGLAVSSLSKWASELGRKSTDESSQEKLSNISNSYTHPGIEIILVSGIRLRFTRTNISEILRFVKALEQ
jgi:hypothetical protein